MPEDLPLFLKCMAVAVPVGLGAGLVFLELDPEGHYAQIPRTVRRLA